MLLKGGKSKAGEGRGEENWKSAVERKRWSGREVVGAYVPVRSTGGEATTKLGRSREPPTLKLTESPASVALSQVFWLKRGRPCGSLVDAARAASVYRAKVLSGCLALETHGASATSSSHGPQAQAQRATAGFWVCLRAHGALGCEDASMLARVMRRWQAGPVGVRRESSIVAQKSMCRWLNFQGLLTGLVPPTTHQVYILQGFDGDASQFRSVCSAGRVATSRQSIV
ncbi:hypothetical protein BGZ60DRAFT_433896 [Tricladium varicosporioides]|nr:hypothetical protein BGZ60DRAFT_433896 [Hymenoscyphus varicosporioides]